MNLTIFDASMICGSWSPLHKSANHIYLCHLERETLSRKTNQLVTLLTNKSWCQEQDLATPMIDINVEMSQETWKILAITTRTDWSMGSNSKLGKKNLKNIRASYISEYKLKFESSNTRNKINRKLICQGVNQFLQLDQFQVKFGKWI